jgi:cytochrome P450
LDDVMTEDKGPTSATESVSTRHPQEGFAPLREHTPVLDMGDGGVLVTRRAEVDHVFRHPEHFSSVANVDLGNVRPMIPLQIDPPEHKKYRHILDPIFAPQRMKELEEPLTELVNAHIDAFVDRDEIDFAQQFSSRFPTQAFVTMLGLPLEELGRFLEMKDGLLRPHQLLDLPLDAPEVAAHKNATAQSVYDYLDAILDERRRRPQDDLLSRFLTTDVAGTRLTRENILDICFLFFVAGLDTVSASLDCFFVFLAEHPAHRRRLVADPSLIPNAVEELLRWETPVMGVPRIATHDLELAGCPVHEGQQVFVLLGAANTDDSEFDDPDEVQWDRTANRHLAFGGGIHRCLGSHLARLELRVALREWHARIPDYRVKPGTELEFSLGIRSLDTFPMELGVSA